MMDTKECVAESNRIEGIVRAPTDAEVNEHLRFTSLSQITIDDLVQFVKVYQPNAVLRDRQGLDVRVGGHVPPRGGPHIVEQLQEILHDATLLSSPWDIHCQYETLHPFTDGNGRSGRALWYWQMRFNRMANLGFLHAFYYQTLNSYRK